jgi:5-methylcytosine-specific restriction endonuclease McrA
MEQLSLPANLKRCSKCRAVKSPAEFSGNKSTRDGLQGQCKSCNRAYYEANRERIALRDTERRVKFPEINRDRCRARYWRDVEASRATGRARAAIQNATPERKAAKHAWERKDRKANPEKWREKSRRDYARDPQGRIEIQHRRRATQLATASVPLVAALLDARWDFYGGLCWLCGDEAVEWDHVKPLSKGGAHMLANLRPACRSCNAQKSASWPLAA